MAENYDRHVGLGLGLTVALFLAFGVYWLSEPARMQAAAQRLNADRAERGAALFRENCVACHGRNGEGVSAPALNDKDLLDSVTDELLLSLVRSGVPGTAMPSWGQANGGPFTDEDIRDLVAFIRNWQPTATSVEAPPRAGDPARGATVFAATCFVCHGPEGRGGRAPALNDPALLGRFDDDWFRDTIAYGRPAKGMPTWATVLSPEQIDDVVALLAAWRRGVHVAPLTPASEHIRAARFAVEREDGLDAEFHLQEALLVASATQVDRLQAALSSIEAEDFEGALGAIEAALAATAGDPEQGQQLFAANCEVCHGLRGGGGIGPDLAESPAVQALSDDALLAFILGGRPQAGMPAWQGRLETAEIQDIIALLRLWQVP